MYNGQLIEAGMISVKRMRGNSHIETTSLHLIELLKVSRHGRGYPRSELKKMNLIN